MFQKKKNHVQLNQKKKKATCPPTAQEIKKRKKKKSKVQSSGKKRKKINKRKRQRAQHLKKRGGGGKKERNWTWAFLSIKQLHFLLSVFSLFWGENFLVGLGRKHPNPTIYFPFSLPNQIHSKEFSFPFFLQNFSSILFHL